MQLQPWLYYNWPHHVSSCQFSPIKRKCNVTSTPHILGLQFRIFHSCLCRVSDCMIYNCNSTIEPPRVENASNKQRKGTAWVSAQTSGMHMKSCSFGGQVGFLSVLQPTKCNWTKQIERTLLAMMNVVHRTYIATHPLLISIINFSSWSLARLNADSDGVLSGWNRGIKWIQRFPYCRHLSIIDDAGCKRHVLFGLSILLCFAVSCSNSWAKPGIGRPIQSEFQQRKHVYNQPEYRMPRRIFINMTRARDFRLVHSWLKVTTEMSSLPGTSYW